VDWATIHRVTYPVEAQTIIAQLEAEGIKVYLKHIDMTPADIFGSNDTAGIKIQVPQKDAETAYNYLLEWEYIETPKEEDKSILDKTYDFTQKIPFLNNLVPEIRLLILVGAFLLLPIIVYFIFKPSEFEQLPNSVWCMDYMEYNNEFYQPSTLFSGFITTLNNQCLEEIKIKTNSIEIPGFNTHKIQGTLDFDENTIFINNCDLLGYVFNGKYKIEINGNIMIMTSPTTTIRAIKQKEFNFQF